MDRVGISWVLLAVLASRSLYAADVQVAWFTDAQVAGAARSAAPAEPLPSAPGTCGKGVALVQAAPVEWPDLRRDLGYVGFWIRPNWDGNDGKAHRLLRIGDRDTGGLVVDKAASGMLRYVMLTPKKMTAARHDVSDWKAGQWHHVVVSWLSVNGRPTGLPLWIDRVCVAGPVFGADEFPDPADRRVWIGDASSDAVMDELVLRARPAAEGREQIRDVYQDYFRTAPYRGIAIDLHPMYGPMDPRVVAGCPKQYGLLAQRPERTERVTDFAVRYAQWSYYDAKPFIAWTTSDPRVATVDATGRVTGVAPGTCTLKAEFRGMKAGQKVTVIGIDQPDLDLVYVERLPKYARDAEKNRPAPGDKVQSVAHVINFGYRPAPAGAEVRFELIPDRNRNFRLDADEKPAVTQKKAIDKALQPREEITETFDWTWTDEPTWVRVVVDPKGRFGEICNANNERCELNLARPLQMAVDRPQLDGFYKDRKINHVGSFSEYDWVNGQLARFGQMLLDAVYPTTSPDGVRDAFRNDRTYVVDTEKTKWEDEPLVKDERFYDGGFPVREPIDLMAIDGAILHEFGHTCTALPDLYGYVVFKENVLLRDPKGEPYAGGALMPQVATHGSVMPFSSANNVPCGVGNPSLMDQCSLWLAPFEAGAIHWLAGWRGGRFWGVQGRMMPTYEQFLKIYDVDDRPLRGAAVYVYGVTNTPCSDAGTKYFADRPKFIDQTDDDGRFRFPGETDASWDDPDTDAVDGAIKVWNPFGRAANLSGTTPDVAFTPNVWIVEGLLLVKIVSAGETEFYWLPLPEFNTLFLSGERLSGTLPVRTSLKPCSEPAPLARPVVPEAVRQANKRPVAVVARREVAVRCNEAFDLDGSKSLDPEGQPLTYHWVSTRGGVSPERSDGAILRAKAPDRPMECEYLFYVIDGLRCSEPVSVRVKVEK